MPQRSNLECIKNNSCQVQGAYGFRKTVSMLVHKLKQGQLIRIYLLELRQTSSFQSTFNIFYCVIILMVPKWENFSENNKLNYMCAGLDSKTKHVSFKKTNLFLFVLQTCQHRLYRINYCYHRHLLNTFLKNVILH